MAQTLYASFADASLAEKAAGALLDYGVRKEDISLVANNERGQAQRTEGAALDTSAGVGRSVGNAGDRAVDDTKSVGHRLAQAGDRAAGVVTGAVGADNASANFHAAADQHSVGAEARAGMAGNEDLVHGSPAAAADRTVYTTGTAGRGDLDEMDADDRSVDPHGSTDLSAKHGISTTTPQDAGAGAVKGAGIGLGLGAVAALASLLIPGVGLVTGAGALATALGGAALTAGAGAIAGGVTGYLKEQGVPGEAAQRYHGAVEHGGALLAVHVPSDSVEQTTVEEVIAKYGGSDVSTY